MLRNSNSSVVNPSVKLFPRLATAIGRQTRMATPGTRDSEATRVRARLLQMILENERVRHNDWRPSAS